MPNILFKFNFLKFSIHMWDCLFAPTSFFLSICLLALISVNCCSINLSYGPTAICMYYIHTWICKFASASLPLKKKKKYSTHSTMPIQFVYRCTHLFIHLFIPSLIVNFRFRNGSEFDLFAAARSRMVVVTRWLAALEWSTSIHQHSGKHTYIHAQLHCCTFWTPCIFIAFKSNSEFYPKACVVLLFVLFS